MKQFKTESKRILDLMINSIYTNKEIFLRELISNASDAIVKRKFKSLTDGSAPVEYEIMITADKAARTLTIEDNGIGMTKDEREKNLGTIAQSGTLDFKKEKGVDDASELIGQFGVGFYSSFMVASNVEVITKAYGGDEAYRWQSSGAEGYTVEPTEKAEAGTKIVITLKADDDDFKYGELLGEYKIESLIKRYSDYIRYPIKMFRTKSRKKEGTEGDKAEYEQYTELETLNSMIPLWKQNKSDVTDEKMNEFYKDSFRDYSDPIKGIFARIEGLVNYDTLFFIPSRAPFDYFSKDYKKGLRLYSNGVMIMDKCEDLLPDCYGFVRGVVDSSDLSLNISREMLQQDRQLKAIATSLEKKLTSELKKLLEEDREKYEKFFKEFGLSLKFGVYNDFGAKKEMLRDLLVFYSGKEKKLVTLSEYVKAMAEDQKEIFYACGENYETISKLPQAEQALDKGFDILFLKDNVDEFVMRILEEYEGKKFKSVSEADFSLATEEERKALDEKSQEMKDVLSYMKTALDGKVKDVCLSSRLKTYPVCLSAAGEVSIEMEKVLGAVPNVGGNVSAEKVLEVNASHQIASKLKTLYETDKDALVRYTKVLYGSARLIEGLPLDDTASFVNDLSSII